MTTPHNPLLLELESHTALGPTYAARLMGLAYVTYAQCRCGSRPLKLYHARHIEALLRLEPKVLRALIQDHTNGNKPK
jgi:hypothetical protein